MANTEHVSVLLEETIAHLDVKPDGLYIDGTLGGGGHSEAVLKRLESGRLLGIDRDPDALDRTREKLAGYGEKFLARKGGFADMRMCAAEEGMVEVDGIMLDLGVSSDQLNQAQRGFSFMQDGPLDMRMDLDQDVSAESWINSAPVDEMIRVFKWYGEEPQAARVAKGIVVAREKERLVRTSDLAELVSDLKGGRRGRKHPATQVFQAVRIAVNDEMGQLERGLDEGLALLKPGGRMAVITFHSLEDRMVKRFFASHEGKMISLQQGGERWEGLEPRMRRVVRKAVNPSEEEVTRNPRARSAKLRVAEKI